MNTQSARNVKEFVHVLVRDDQGRPTRLLVPGHEGRSYKVDLERNGRLEATCRQIGESGTVFYADCKGAQHNICYHILAACMVAAEKQGEVLEWLTDDFNQLQQGLGGKLYSVKSAQSGKVARFIIRTQIEAEPELADAGLSKEALIALALEKTGDKTQWFTGETVWLTDDTFLKNDDGVIRLYRISQGEPFRARPEMLAVVYRLNPRSGEWKPQAQLTPAQAEAELYDDRDLALLVEPERGRNKLFK